MRSDAPAEDVDPALAHAIEDALLFGKQPQLEALLEQLATETRLSDALRHDLESLIYFRAYYGAAPDLTDADRQHITRIDADWTMQLIQRLHRRVFGDTARREA